MKKSGVLTAGLGLVFMSIGCGGSNPASTLPQAPAAAVPQASVPAPANTCASGQFHIDGSCLACTGPGRAVVTVGGKQLCKLDTLVIGYGGAIGLAPLYSTYALFGGGGMLFPVVSSSYPYGNPASQQLYPAGPTVQIQKNEQVSVSASGSWGTQDTSWFQIWFNGQDITGSSCSQIGIDGTSSGTVKMNSADSLPAGLVASDGTQLYKVGASATFTVQNDGYLHLGINAPDDSSSTICTSALTITNLKLSRCMDVNGTLYPCQ